MVFHTNIIIVLGISLGLFLFWLSWAAKKQTVTVTPALGCFATTCIVLALPLTYTTEARFPIAAWRVTGLVAGGFFYFSCLQVHWGQRRVLAVLYGILFLVIVQAVVAGQQWLAPEDAWVPLYGRRIYGTFFQPNVFASFMATGIALTLTLLLLPAMALLPPHRERARLSGLHLLLVGFSALLVCAQSRAGWLGAVTAAAVLLLYSGRLNPSLAVKAAAAIGGGIVLGGCAVLAGSSRFSLVDHAQSNLARWTMLRDTLAMMADKPWLGWGYGGFEYDFQHFRIHQSIPTLVTEIARHPHNEIMLWAVEGGLVGLTGMILVLAGGGVIARQTLKRDRIAHVPLAPMTGVPSALCIALLPMAIHTLLEFPFYLSTLHFAVFLLLLAMADSLSIESTKKRPFTGTTGKRLAYPLAALALGGGVLAAFTLKGGQTLTHVETFGMEDVTPLKKLPTLSRLLLEERITFDEQIGALMTYNRTQDEHLLEGYSRWAQAYLQRRIDKNVYASLILALRHQKHGAVAERYRREAALFFPTDMRFAVPLTDTAGAHINTRRE